MSCKKYEKWVYLFWDDRLNPKQEEQFKKHLAECGGCQKKLSFLEMVEGKAKETHVKEPPPEYWDAFSGRVREKIISRKESSPAFGLKRFLESIFVISPWKIRVAAGMVSIVLVFIIGKLYMDYRGKEIIPTGSITREVKEQPLKTTEIEKKETPPPGEIRGKTETSVDKTKRMPEPVVSDRSREKSVTQEIEGSEKPVLMKDQEVAVPAQTVEGKSTPPSSAPQAEAITPNMAKQEVPKETPSGAGAVGERKVEKIKVETASSQAEKDREGKNIQEILATEKGFVNKDVTKSVRTSLISVPSTDQFVIDQKAIPKLDETDTLISAEDLGGIIRRWKDHFADSPADPLNDQGYLQVATAYLLLGRLSADSTVFDQGSALIEQYMNRTQDPTTKDQLNQSLEKLKALGKK